MLNRELLKEKKFKTSCLNIKLVRFAGYESDGDIYLFQSDFEKLNLSETQTELKVRHRASAAYNPPSNGRAELSVKSTKRLL